MIEIEFTDKQVMLNSVNSSREQGHTVIPFDDPEKGMVGWTVIQQDGKEYWLKYFIYGKPLQPEIKLFEDCDEFLAELEKRIDSNCIEPGDNIKESKVGFISYEKAFEGRSLVFQISVDILRHNKYSRGRLTAMLDRMKSGSVN